MYARVATAILIGSVAALMASLGHRLRLTPPSQTADAAHRSQAAEPTHNGGVATLFSRDEAMCAFSLRRHDYGVVVEENRLVNKMTDLMFNRYGNGVIAVAVEGGSTGAIVDIGDTMIKGSDTSVFWCLTRTGDKVMCQGETITPVEPTDFSRCVLKSPATVPAVVGHTYLLKCRYNDEPTPLYAAIRVVDLEEKRSVTLRWRRLE